MTKQYRNNSSFVGADKKAVDFEQFKHLSDFEAISKLAALSVNKIFDGDLGFMSGHYRYQDIAPFITPMQANVSVITFIRHPVMRTVSDYFYCCSPKHPPNEKFRSLFPNIETFVREETTINRHFEYLKPHATASVAETIENVRENIDFIGRTELFQSDAEDLFGRIGIQDIPHEFANKNHFADMVIQTFESHYDFIADNIQDDLVLYEALIEDKRNAPKSHLQNEKSRSI